MLYISNAFSLASLGARQPGFTDRILRVSRLTDDEAVMLTLVHADNHTVIVGHADIAAIMSRKLGDMHIPVNRISADVQVGDSVLVAQYVGPRLPEGTKELPEGAEIIWLLVSVVAQCRAGDEVAA